MKDILISTGYTSVSLAVSMKQFVEQERENERLFASIRGSDALARIIQDEWREMMEANDLFVLTEEYGMPHENMTADETGFVTGVFRSNMIQTYSAPTYKLDKSLLNFPPELSSNYQFRRLFQPVLKRWEIYIRPTMTGMFMIRLVRRYDNATSVIRMARDVLDLQTSLDVQGALGQFEKIEEEFADNRKKREERIQSVNTLLDWIGVHTDHPRLSYIPVQTQLAMMICRQFVQGIGSVIDLHENGNGKVRLRETGQTIAESQHDTYVIYHLDNIMTRLDKNFKPLPNNNARHVNTSEILSNYEMKQEIVNLLEGAMLRREPDQSGERRSYFPAHSTEYIDKVINRNQATWQDELCFLTSRTAVIRPSWRDRKAELYISTLPATPTTSVQYASYWDALERMLEFVVEIRLLAQLLERSSADILQDFVGTLRSVRANMLKGNLKVDRNQLVGLVEESANLIRVVGLCQSLTNPQVWSRAEYSSEKAQTLLNEMQVEVLLEHAERNVTSLTSLVNHTDELYLAELSERSNQRTVWLSIVLAAVSLSIILFSLPSFWADIDQLNSTAIPSIIRDGAVPLLTQIGSVLGPVMILISLVTIFLGAFLFVWRIIRNTVLSIQRRLRRISFRFWRRSKKRQIDDSKQVTVIPRRI